jgi:hypothetical protein
VANARASLVIPSASRLYVSLTAPRPKDVAGVQNDLELATPEVARPAREGQALPEDRPHPLVEDQTRPKQLQRTLGEGSLL